MTAVHLREGLSRSHAHGSNVLCQGRWINEDAILGMKNLPKISWKPNKINIQKSAIIINIHLGGMEWQLSALVLS